MLGTRLSLDLEGAAGILGVQLSVDLVGDAGIFGVQLTVDRRTDCCGIADGALPQELSAKVAASRASIPSGVVRDIWKPRILKPKNPTFPTLSIRELVHGLH
ncbi:MAG: hypothetical protein GIW99_04120 [Candidatus Eremiobacteraeota bacterium]|nr:hypothetical protein [Candidatus Eremiobacteraeota bacterium]MBC5826858.1 hypothetical protein [Candidatus Eremiobacteraeota bacterium]